MDDFLADHTIDVGLGGELVSDVVEEEEFLFILGLHHQFVLAVGQVDTAGETRLGVIGLQPDHHLHLLLSVQPAAGRRLHRLLNQFGKYYKMTFQRPLPHSSRACRGVEGEGVGLEESLEGIINVVRRRECWCIKYVYLVVGYSYW